MARRIKEEPEAHKNRIAAEAQKLFSVKGITGTTMDEISALAGYSKATVYVYFKNKDDIVRYLALKSMESLKDALKEAVDTSKDIKEQFIDMCFSLAGYQREYPEYYNMALQFITYEKGDEIFNTGEEINSFVIDLLGTQGVKCDAQDVLHLWAMTSGVINLAYQKSKYIGEDLQIELDSFLREGFEKIFRTIRA